MWLWCYLLKLDVVLLTLSVLHRDCFLPLMFVLHACSVLLSLPVLLAVHACVLHLLVLFVLHADCFLPLMLLPDRCLLLKVHLLLMVLPVWVDVVALPLAVDPSAAVPRLVLLSLPVLLAVHACVLHLLVLFVLHADFFLPWILQTKRCLLLKVHLLLMVLPVWVDVVALPLAVDPSAAVPRLVLLSLPVLLAVHACVLHLLALFVLHADCFLPLMLLPDRCLLLKVHLLLMVLPVWVDVVALPLAVDPSAAVPRLVLLSLPVLLAVHACVLHLLVLFVLHADCFLPLMLLPDRCLLLKVHLLLMVLPVWVDVVALPLAVDPCAAVPRLVLLSLPVLLAVHACVLHLLVLFVLHADCFLPLMLLPDRCLLLKVHLLLMVLPVWVDVVALPLAVDPSAAVPRLVLLSLPVLLAVHACVLHLLVLFVLHADCFLPLMLLPDRCLLLKVHLLLMVLPVWVDVVALPLAVDPSAAVPRLVLLSLPVPLAVHACVLHLLVLFVLHADCFLPLMLLPDRCLLLKVHLLLMVLPVWVDVVALPLAVDPCAAVPRLVLLSLPVLLAVHACVLHLLVLFVLHDLHGDCCLPLMLLRQLCILLKPHLVLLLLHLVLMVAVLLFVPTNVLEFHHIASQCHKFHGRELLLATKQCHQYHVFVDRYKGSTNHNAQI